RLRAHVDKCTKKTNPELASVTVPREPPLPVPVPTTLGAASLLPAEASMLKAPIGTLKTFGSSLKLGTAVKHREPLLSIPRSPSPVSSPPSPVVLDSPSYHSISSSATTGISDVQMHEPSPLMLRKEKLDSEVLKPFKTGGPNVPSAADPSPAMCPDSVYIVDYTPLHIPMDPPVPAKPPTKMPFLTPNYCACFPYGTELEHQPDCTEGIHDHDYPDFVPSPTSLSKSLPHECNCFIPSGSDVQHFPDCEIALEVLDCLMFNCEIE
ncbi:hypothetical protein HDU93_008529, partial [Gonapodya sp. JEL0774]